MLINPTQIDIRGLDPWASPARVIMQAGPKLAGCSSGSTSHLSSKRQNHSTCQNNTSFYPFTNHQKNLIKQDVVGCGKSLRPCNNLNTLNLYKLIKKFIIFLILLNSQHWHKEWIRNWFIVSIKRNRNQARKENMKIHSLDRNIESAMTDCKM